MRRLLAPALLAVLVAGCTPTAAEQARIDERNAVAQTKLADELAGLTPGEPVSCIRLIQSQQIKAYGPTILYRVSGNLVYRSETAGGCEGIANGDVIVTRTPTGQLCRGDIGQTFRPVANILTGSCSFGEFVPYRKR